MLKRSKGSNHEVLFHHRFSTSTADVPNACHPFSTKDHFKNNYVGVHNGVLSNENKLEKAHLALGINYVSKQKDGRFNDSEALVYDIARYLEGEVDELTAQGSIAFIMIKRNKDGKPTTLFFGRNSGNPLMIKKTKHSLTISSQGEGKPAEVNQLYSYDYDTGELTKRYMYIPYYKSNWNSNSEYYGYSGSHYNSSGAVHRPGWDDEEGEEERFLQQQELIEEFEDYNGYGTWVGEDAMSIINKGEFIPRSGTDEQIEHQMMLEAQGDYSEAALACLVEAEEAEQEETRINKVIYEVATNEAYDDLCEYWYQVNAYKGLMARMAEKFEKASLVLVSQQPIIDNGEGIVVTNEERSLLPVNVMAHNPKAV